MTCTYTAGGTGDKDRIRARIGDTDTTAPTNQRLEDEEIADFVTTEGSYRIAGAVCARALSAKFFRLAAQKTIGHLQLTYQRRAEGLLDIAAALERQAATVVKPLCGGMSIAEKASDASNTDRVQPANQRGDFDNPLAGNPSTPPMVNSL